VQGRKKKHQESAAAAEVRSVRARAPEGPSARTAARATANTGVRRRAGSARTASSPPPPCPPARALPPPPPPRRAGWSPLGGAGFALGGMCCVLQSLQWPLWRPCSVLAVVCAVVLAPPLLLAPVLALSALRQPPPTPPPRRCPPDWSPLGGAGLRWVACAAFSSSTVPAVAPLASMLAVARAGGGGLSPMRLCT
jgi:hypothetical protein